MTSQLVELTSDPRGSGRPAGAEASGLRRRPSRCPVTALTAKAPFLKQAEKKIPISKDEKNKNEMKKIVENKSRNRSYKHYCTVVLILAEEYIVKVAYIIDRIVNDESDGTGNGYRPGPGPVKTSKKTCDEIDDPGRAQEEKLHPDCDAVCRTRLSRQAVKFRDQKNW